MSVISDSYIEELYAESKGCKDISADLKRQWLHLNLLKITSGIWVDDETYGLLIFGGLVMEKKVWKRYEKRPTLLGKKLIEEFKNKEC